MTQEEGDVKEDVKPKLNLTITFEHQSEPPLPRSLILLYVKFI